MKVENLTKIYKTSSDDVLALDNVSISFPEKGMAFIVGVSGSGKSTLLNILSGVDYPTKGEVYIGKKNLYKELKKDMSKYRNSYVGFVFQDYNLIEDLDVYQNIKISLDFLGIKDTSIIDDVMEKVDILDIKHSKVSEISSGQMQRVAIARCLVKNSRVILADEPTGNLDSKNTTIVMDLLKEISKDRLVIIITHDNDAALKYGDFLVGLEDGKIISLENKIETKEEEKEETINFKRPKITFFDQLKFTFGFIKSNLARSIALMISLILIPIVGSILAGYAFFDFGDSYKRHQDEYQSNFVNLSKVSADLEICYEGDELDIIKNKYENANFIEKYITYINLNTSHKEESDIYAEEVKNILVTDDIKNYYGSKPFPYSNEIMITDYLLDSYHYYVGDVNYDEIILNVDGVWCNVVGVVMTDYKESSKFDRKDKFSEMAFLENLEYYNSIITTKECYDTIFNQMTCYNESIIYRYKDNGETRTIYDRIGIYSEKDINILKVVNPQYGVSENFIAVSKPLLEEIIGTNMDSAEISSFYFIGYSKARVKISYQIGAVYESDEKEITISLLNFELLKEDLKRCKLMITKDDPMYSEIVSNESVVNPSYKYAYQMKQKTDSTKTTMIEILVTLIIILIVFGQITNQMTASSEKKKIGIKYSFGINKGPIVVPYILELTIYIILGLSLSLLFIKGGVYQLFLKEFIYNTKEELMVFSFFDISYKIMLIWDLVIFFIMISSLIMLILNICKKSPIEIIRDL